MHTIISNFINFLGKNEVRLKQENMLEKFKDLKESGHNEDFLLSQFFMP